MEKFIAAAGSQPRSEEELFGLSEDPWTPLPDAWVEAAKKASVDWRTWPGGRNATTPIKKQCGGSCGTYARLEAAESQHFLKTGQLVTLSDRQVLSCHYNSSAPDYNPSYGGSRGIDPANVFPCIDQFFHECSGKNCGENGGNPANKPIETNCTYDTTPDSSGNPAGCWKYFVPSKAIKGWSNYTANQIPRGSLSSAGEDMVAAWVLRNGPVQTAVNSLLGTTADEQSFVTADNCVHGHTNHATNIVGFGTHPLKGPYWIIRNSWGSNFGDGGFVKLARGAHCASCCTTARLQMYGDPSAYWPKAGEAPPKPAPPPPIAQYPPGPCMVPTKPLDQGQVYEIGLQNCDFAPQWNFPANNTNASSPVTLKSDKTMCLATRALGGTIPSTCKQEPGQCYGNGISGAFFKFQTAYPTACCYACQNSGAQSAKQLEKQVEAGGYASTCTGWTHDAANETCTLHNVTATLTSCGANMTAGTRAPALAGKQQNRVPSFQNRSLVLAKCDGSADQMWTYNTFASVWGGVGGALSQPQSGDCAETTLCDGWRTCEGKRIQPAKCTGAPGSRAPKPQIFAYGYQTVHCLPGMPSCGSGCCLVKTSASVGKVWANGGCLGVCAYE
ncbi:uncharacterized protein [Oscarella lobularis]